MRNDFESGSIDVFYLNLPELHTAVTEIEIRRDSSGPDDEW